ncbi:mRNA capping nucleoside-triphosphatase [Blastomyces dermatitidis ATCC 18188]|uniref:mRNA-capping enzyme subunit beta n=1 Tax=Ajellomyces dermatitidis (strain ATCC 18188 / CBS 674.68) TaxID=653446 RepID=F2TIS9_AJEDA|nr:mRNA capping nucleoside-triphosphatase [Blastomyces dermatitidis ATCC 18188]EQL29503.1 hypothetical protein, variant 1 [Blastomyces dermatitidis ATCC 26199]EQL29504.1 hypothetical protein, variant 2 [Blastomyces dermatitidis ATCC 26199]
MDLRTIINNDAAAGGVQRASAAQPPPPSPQQPQGHDLDSLHPTKKHDDVSPASYHTTQQPQQTPEFRTRPPQPPPLQPPLHSPGGSSSYGSAHSPYQHTSASTLSSGGPQSQGAHPVPHALQTYHPVSRDNFPPNSAGSAYNQSAGPLSSPYTPQAMSAGTPQSYFSQQRSQSAHSIQTPTSAHSYSYPHRESIGAPQQQPIQQHQQSFSPNQQRSHPGTPLGPPPTSFSRPSPHQPRPPSAGFDSQQQRSLSGSWGSQDVQLRNKRDVGSPIAQTTVARQDSGLGGENQRRYSVGTEERSTPQPYRKDANDATWENNSNSALHFPGHPHDASDTIPSQYPPSTPRTPQPANTSRPPTTSPPTRRLRQSEPPASNMSGQSQLVVKEDAPINRSMLPSGISKKKRRRYDEPPIYARKAPRTSGNPPPIPTGHYVPPFKRAIAKQEPQADRVVSRTRSLPPPPPHPIAEAPNGETTTNGNLPARPPPVDQTATSLGPWEPSITGLIPHEEVTKLICDFLFQQVVMRRDIGAGPAGGSAIGQGAVLEVEAKLGMLVDRNRGERVRIPALTECILAKDDPSIRVGFESSMSLAQHRALNDFLNDIVKSSISQPGARIPLTYAHKKERDTFYEISSSALPPIIQHHLNPRHKPKVRVTTDQRTGAVLARIIKCRIADLDVYSPRTCLDWRISVNLEMNYEGDIGELNLPGEPSSLSGPGAPRGGARSKDRMSYRHLAYQIDLTQVATSEDGSNNPQSDFEHELEIEISSAEVRRQGDLALAGDPKNQYEELIKGFVDNIRVLARAVPGR